jgi:hypothetical protein
MERTIMNLMSFVRYIEGRDGDMSCILLVFVVAF